MWVLRREPQCPHTAIPPESSQVLLEFRDGVQVFISILSRARAMVSCGIPESGTGMAVHSSRGRSSRLTFFLFVRTDSATTETVVAVLFSLPHQKVPR